MASELKSTLEICGEQCFKVHSIEVEVLKLKMLTHKREIFDLETSIYTSRPLENNNTEAPHNYTYKR